MLFDNKRFRVSTNGYWPRTGTNDASSGTGISMLGTPTTIHPIQLFILEKIHWLLKSNYFCERIRYTQLVSNQISLGYFTGRFQLQIAEISCYSWAGVPLTRPRCHGEAWTQLRSFSLLFHLFVLLSFASFSKCFFPILIFSMKIALLKISMFILVIFFSCSF